VDTLNVKVGTVERLLKEEVRKGEELRMEIKETVGEEHLSSY
jgi:hypothetical protein